MNHRLIIINNWNWNVVRVQSVLGVSRRNLNKYKQIKKGDKLVFYIIGVRNIGNRIYSVEKKFFSRSKLFAEPDNYFYRLQLLCLEKGKSQKLTQNAIDKLKFIKNKRYWSGSIRGKTIIDLNENDFNLLKEIIIKNKRRDTM